MNANVEKILGASGGALVGGVALKKVKSPITAVAVLGAGVLLAIKGKTSLQKSLGLGLASIGAIGTLGKVAEKVEAMQSFTPSINGMGDLYEDEDGNVFEMNGLNGPELVQDEYGNSYMVDGLTGEELEMDENLMGLYGDDDLDDLVGDDEYDDEYDDDYELEGVGNLTELV